MLGRDLIATLGGRHDVRALSRTEADITDASQALSAISLAAPDAVIHAAAFTAVDQCEKDPDAAFRTNATGTAHVAGACRQLGIPLLYVSTDYVFDGTKSTPYHEGDQPNPLSVYGKSKWMGENSVRQLLDRFWIVRISWLFGPHGRNFVRTILTLARDGKPLRIVDDQYGAPTYTEDLAVKLGEIVLRAPSGIYHVTNEGYCSWFEFARQVLHQAGLDGVPVSPITTSEAGRPAPRPPNSRLENRRLKASGLGLLPPWQEALTRYLARDAKSHGIPHGATPPSSSSRGEVPGNG